MKTDLVLFSREFSVERKLELADHDFANCGHNILRVKFFQGDINVGRPKQRTLVLATDRNVERGSQFHK